MNLKHQNWVIRFLACCLTLVLLVGCSGDPKPPGGGGGDPKPPVTEPVDITLIGSRSNATGNIVPGESAKMPPGPIKVTLHFNTRIDHESVNVKVDSTRWNVLPFETMSDEQAYDFLLLPDQEKPTGTLTVTVGVVKDHKGNKVTNKEIKFFVRITEPDAEPQPNPQPPGVPEIWKPLDREVRRVDGGYTEQLSVVAVDLKTGARYEYHSDTIYPPASTFKLPVSICITKAIQRGELSWGTKIEFTQDDYDPVTRLTLGEKYTVRRVVDSAIIYSDNAAARMLARTLTEEKLVQCTRAMHGPVTRRNGESTWVTASSEANWWNELYQMHENSPEAAEQLLDPLRRVTYHGRIEAGTPEPGIVTHKYGVLPEYNHDGAIVWAKRPYVLVVLSKGKDRGAADRVIELIASAAYEAAMRDE